MNFRGWKEEEESLPEAEISSDLAFLYSKMQQDLIFLHARVNLACKMQADDFRRINLLAAEQHLLDLSRKFELMYHIKKQTNSINEDHLKLCDNQLKSIIECVSFSLRSPESAARLEEMAIEVSKLRDAALDLIKNIDYEDSKTH